MNLIQKKESQHKVQIDEQVNIVNGFNKMETISNRSSCNDLPEAEAMPAYGKFKSRKFDGDFCENDIERFYKSRQKMLKEAVMNNTINVCSSLWASCMPQSQGGEGDYQDKKPIDLNLGSGLGSGASSKRVSRGPSGFNVLRNQNSLESSRQDSQSGLNFTKEEIESFLASNPMHLKLYERAKSKQLANGFMKRFTNKLFASKKNTEQHMESGMVSLVTSVGIVGGMDRLNTLPGDRGAVVSASSRRGNQNFQVAGSLNHRSNTRNQSLANQVTIQVAPLNQGDGDQRSKIVTPVSSQPGGSVTNKASLTGHTSKYQRLTTKQQAGTSTSTFYPRTATGKRNLDFYRFLQEQNVRHTRLRNDQKFFKFTQTNATKQHKEQVDAIGVSETLDTSYMDKLGARTSKQCHQLLAESKGRSDLKAMKQSVRSMNSHLFQITTQQENENKVDPIKKQKKFINMLQKEKYPVDHDEKQLIAKELETVKRTNAVYKNTMKLKQRCEAQKTEFMIFKEKEKERTIRLTQQLIQQELIDKKKVSDAYAMHRLLESEYTKTKHFFQGKQSVKNDQSEYSPSPEPRTQSLNSVKLVNSTIESQVTKAEINNLTEADKIGSQRIIPSDLESGGTYRKPPEILISNEGTSSNSARLNHNKDFRTIHSYSETRQKESSVKKSNPSIETKQSSHNNRTGSAMTGNSMKIIDSLKPNAMGNCLSGEKKPSLIEIKRAARTIQTAKNHSNQRTIKFFKGDSTTHHNRTHSTIQINDYTAEQPNKLSNLLNKKVMESFNQEICTSELEKKDEGVSNRIMCKRESLEKLILNDTSKYEKSQKAVIQEFFELSRSSYHILRKKIKV